MTTLRQCCVMHCKHVSQHMSFLGESPLTYEACERFFSRMNPHVGGQIMWVGKDLPAVTTFVFRGISI